MTKRIGAHVSAIIYRYSVEANYKNVYHSWWFHLWGLQETNAPLPTGKKRRLPYLESIEATFSVHFRKMLMMLQVLCVRGKRRADFTVKNAGT